MGSGGSKGDCSGGASSSNGSLRKGKCKGSRVFQSSCLGASSRSRHYNNDDTTVSENGLKSNVAEMDSDQVKIECYRKVKVGQNDCISSSNDEWSVDNNVGSRTGSGSGTAVSAQSLSSPARLLSRFSFVPGNGSFRLSRANSLGSSRAYPVPSSSLRMFNDDKEDEDRVRPRSAGGVIDLNGTQQSDDLLSVSLGNRTAQCNDESSSNFRFHSHTSEFFGDVLDNGTVLSIHNAPRHEDGSFVGFNGQYRSPRVAASGSIEGRVSDRRTAGQEPSERNVRFSRTLSVGRLRDRVLHRSSLTDLNFCPMQQEREATDSNLGVGRQVFGGERRESESEGNTGNFQPTSGYLSSGMSSSLFSNQDHEVETSRSREARYHDLLEHRSNFLERRRRIRSQVRALQRLGNRFENLSGHERSCILSGQHRTGCCTCRVNNRNINSNDDTSARASISRIVMLAEALFEVLDEIHQQSAVLSSRPSVSSLGSVPAPNDVVDSLPIRLYTKSQKHHKEEAAQCYICLVEYEEGDSMRVLPCRHEFHRTCVDKWLKEIHRVCPLCRGDICRYDALPAENRGLSVNTFS